jgi:hypothetical protein
MIRKINTIPQSIIERMRYANPVLTADWKKTFSRKPAPPAAPVRKTVMKPARRIIKKAAEPAVKPVRKAAANPEMKPLVFIKKEPVTFQIRREKHPEEFERTVFVIRACSRDPSRAHLTVLHVEQTRTGSRLVGTDGMRLHVAEIAMKIPSGDYKPVLTKDTVSLGEPVTGIMFPNWKRVIPENTRKRGVINMEDSGWGKDRNQSERLSLAFSAFLRQTGELVNLRFLEDLTKKKWSVYCQDEQGKAIFLKEEGAGPDACAVIMPLAQANSGSKAA